MTVDEVDKKDWTPFRKYEWNIYTSLENMADNGVDISHFKFVHGAPSVPDYQLRIRRDPAIGSGPHRSFPRRDQGDHQFVRPMVPARAW
ncbi:hypothetical protein AB5I41_14510 [Sphingomonas sp. MMS24-JH45]